MFDSGRKVDDVPQENRLERENTNLWFFIAIACIIVASYWIAMKFDKTYGDILLGIGTGIASSTFVVWAYGRFAEERSQVRIGKEATNAALNAAGAFLKARFQQVLPKSTYPKSKRPTEEFRRDFVLHLVRSKIYLHRGDDAGFAAFRMATHASHPAVKSLLTVHFCVLDPRADAHVRQRAKLEIENSGEQRYSEAQLQQQASKVRRKIFVTLFSLFTIRYVRSVEVFFHRDISFFRSEIFDDAVFLSFYRGGEFPGSYQFEKDSFVYQAFLNATQMSMEASAYRIRFDATLTEEAFKQHLQELGCDIDFSDLESAWTKEKARKSRALPFELNELF